MSDAIPLHSSVSCLSFICCGVGFHTKIGIKSHVLNVGCCGDYRRSCVSGYTVQISRLYVFNLKSRTSYVITPSNMVKIHE